jgi:hypothetical protein
LKSALEAQGHRGSEFDEKAAGEKSRAAFRFTLAVRFGWC